MRLNSPGNCSDSTPHNGSGSGVHPSAGAKAKAVIGILDADELEDYLELRDERVAAAIRHSNADLTAGRVRPAEVLLKPARATARSRKPRRS